MYPQSPVSPNRCDPIRSDPITSNRRNRAINYIVNERAIFCGRKCQSKRNNVYSARTKMSLFDGEPTRAIEQASTPSMFSNIIGLFGAIYFYLFFFLFDRFDCLATHSPNIDDDFKHVIYLIRTQHTNGIRIENESNRDSKRYERTKIQ